MTIATTNKKNSINLLKKIAKNISSRDVVQKLNPIIEKINAKRIELDFNDIEFISRSAAHELLLIKEKWFYKQKKKLIFQNTNDDVKKMIKAVASSRAIPDKNIKKINLKVTNIKNLDIEY